MQFPNIKLTPGAFTNDKKYKADTVVLASL